MTMLNMLEMERYIAASAKRADLRVVWHDKEVASTDGKIINLPRMNDRTTLADYKKLVHYVTHEVDHILYSDFKLLQEKNVTAQNSLMGAIWNMLEDHRIEWLGDKEFEGDRRINDEVETQQLAGIVSKLGDVPDEHEAKQHITPLLAWNAEVKADFHPSLFSVKQALEDAVPAMSKDKLDKLNNGDYGDVLRNIRDIEDVKQGTLATYELAKRIFKEVFNQDPEAEEKRCQEEKQKEKGEGGEGQGEGEGEEGEGGEKADGEGGGKEKEQSSEGNGKEKKKARPNYGMYLDDDHSSKGGNPQRNLTLDYSKYKHTNHYTPATERDYRVHDHTTLPLRPCSHRERDINDALRHTSDQFAARVRTLLQIRSRSRYQYGTKTGKLHGSALHRIMVDAPGYSDHLFKRKIDTNILNSAVSLVIDQSGSMSGDKYSHAAAAAAMLSDTIGNVLHIPVEVVSFTDYGQASRGNLCHMHIHRKFDDKRVAKDVLVKRFATSAQEMSGNADGDAIMWAFDRLIKRKEPRKLMVVFSDGQPAGGGRGDINWYTKHVIENIEQKSPVQIYGIGICDRSVKHFYKEHQVINRASELETTLLSLIERKLV